MNKLEWFALWLMLGVVIFLLWLKEAPAVCWTCSDVPCQVSEQCPPGCSYCAAGWCQP